MSDNLAFIEVAVALPVHNTFTYSAGEDLASLVSTGKRVLVPFGRRRLTGFEISAGLPRPAFNSVSLRLKTCYPIGRWLDLRRRRKPTGSYEIPEEMRATASAMAIADDDADFE